MSDAPGSEGPPTEAEKSPEGPLNLLNNSEAPGNAIKILLLIISPAQVHFSWDR